MSKWSQVRQGVKRVIPNTRGAASGRASSTAGKRRALRECAIEALEDRLLFNAGGGWSSGTTPFDYSGIVGSYYSNTSFSGSAAFQRADVRVDFTAGTELPGGSLPTDPAFGSVIPANGFSIAWDGSLIPKYTEAYTLEIYGTSNDSNKLIIDGSTVATGSGDLTATYTFTAGATYSVVLDYVHSASATWQEQLHWSSSGANPFGEEAVEPATPIGGNMPSEEGVDAGGTADAALGAPYEAIGGAPTPVSGTLTSGSTTITGMLSGLSDFAVGQWIDADGLPSGTTVSAISTTNYTITVSQAATQTGVQTLVADAPPPLNSSSGQPMGDFSLQSFQGVSSEVAYGTYTVTFNGAAELYDNGSQDMNFLTGYDGVNNDAGTITSGSAEVTGVTNTTALFQGEHLSGTGFPANDQINYINTTNNSFSMSEAATLSTQTAFTAYIAGTYTSGSTTISASPANNNLFVGESISGPGIPAGDTITGLGSSGTVVTLSTAVTAGGTGVTLTPYVQVNGGTYYPYVSTIPLGDMTYDPATGTGYNPANNTTKVLVQLRTGSYDNLYFLNTSQNGYGAAGSPVTATTGGGVSNLSIMTPTQQNGSVDFAAGTIFNPAYLAVFAPYSAIRSNVTAWDPDETDAANGTDWTYRNEPSPWDWFANPNISHDGFGPEDVQYQAPPWEEEILLSNETGKDLYINIPATASNNYVQGLVNLLKNGDTVDGVTYPGLLPNLNIYVEYGNEIWGGTFTDPGIVVEDVNGQRAADTATYQAYLAAGGGATIAQPVNLSGTYNQTGVYASGATYSSSGGLDGAGNSLLGYQIEDDTDYYWPATPGTAALSDDTATTLPSGYNSTGYEQPSTAIALREDFTVPTGTSISINDLQAFAGATSSLGTTSGSEVVVQIWQTSGGNTLVGAGPIASGTLSSTDSTEVGTSGYYALNGFSPVGLSSGNYAVIATYPTNFVFYNSNFSGSTRTVSNTGNGLVSFPADDGQSANCWFYNGSSYSSATTWSEPLVTSLINAYGAGTFTYNVANVVAAQGQTVATMAGSYSNLFLYATAVNSDQSDQTFTVSYTNGSSTTFSRTMSGWNDPLTPYGFAGNTTSGSATVTSASNITNLYVDEMINGGGFPTGTWVQSVNTTTGTVVLNQAATSTGSGVGLTADPYSGLITSGSTTVTSVPETTGLFVGETITGAGIPSGATIASIGTGTFVLSNAATATITQPEAFGDGESITQTYSAYGTSAGTAASGDRYLYSYDFPLNSGWTISSVTLPNNYSDKIIAMTLEGTNINSPGTIFNFNNQDWEVLRLEEISGIFRGVYGNAEMPSSTEGSPNADPRIRPNYAWQYSGQFNEGYGNSEEALSVVQDTTGQDANFFLWGGGGGWYEDDLDTVATTASQLFADLPGMQSVPVGTNVPAYGSHAQGLDITQDILSDEQVNQQFGLHDIGYEGGADMGAFSSLNLTADEAAQDSPSMTTFVSSAVDSFEQATGGTGIPFVYEIIDDIYPTTDMWGTVNTIYSPNTNKVQGYINAGAALPPTTLPAGWTAAPTGGTSYTTFTAGNVISGSTVVDVSSTLGLVMGEVVSGSGVYGSIAGIGTNSFTLSTAATATVNNDFMSITPVGGNSQGDLDGPNTENNNWTLDSVNPNNTGFANRSPTSDQYFAVTTPVSGNVTVSAELTSATTSSYGNAGLIMRTSSSQGAPDVALFADATDGGFYMEYRPSQGATRTIAASTTSFAPPGGSNSPVWMEITETGDVFTGLLASNNGGQPGTWTTLGTVTLTSTNFPTSAFAAGLYQDSDGSAFYGRAVSTFQNVSATQDSEPFNYTNGSSLNGQSSGTGWDGNWTVASGANDGTITSSSLSAPSGTTFSPAPTGNAVQLTGTSGANATDFRAFAPTSAPITTGTLFVSFLMNRSNVNDRTTSLSLYSGGPTGTEVLGIGYNGNAAGDLGFYYNGGASYAATSTVAQANTTYLIVAAITFNGSSSTVQMYVNPTGTAQPGAPSASATVSGLSAGVDTLRLFAGGGSLGTTSTIFDEIKLGTSWAEVI